MLKNGQGLPALLSALNIVGSPIQGAMFEFIPNCVEGTNFDFMLPLQSLGRVYFELKYTENEFSKATADERHLRKFRDVYKTKLTGRFEESFCCVSRFLSNYQIMRNVWHLREDKDDIVIFLIPRANKALRRQESIIKSCAIEPFRSRIRIVYIEDLITALDRELRLTNGNEETYLQILAENIFRCMKLPRVSSPNSSGSCRNILPYQGG
jgi:hypothetical protein